MDRAAPYVVGQYLGDKPMEPLYELFLVTRSTSPTPQITLKYRLQSAIGLFILSQFLTRLGWEE
ncbi:hypothetical protein [Rhizobium sp. PL01]|uniref:hypothetical protein n=1 Tax=Rhizobium sp. PL01 TaxID=3085631 RepID=UPI0029829C00|nr:hypothetical protein [Rhizobium sp. PL01]MDW5315282.1 hypothetical protein [Rhizobium sp. PL01]